MTAPIYLSKDAVISSCALYRYQLRRCWDGNLPPYVCGMLNPSTADANQDDPTITRVVRRAALLGFGSIVIWNLYAYRATDPSQLRLVHDPVGPDNLKWIRSALLECQKKGGKAVVGWGAGGSDVNIVSRIRQLALEIQVELHCLGTTNDGHPRHPLYVSYGTPLQKWENQPLGVGADAAGAGAGTGTGTGTGACF